MNCLIINLYTLHTPQSYPHTYIQPLFSIFDKYPHITYHSYADDIQIQLEITDPSSDITTINNCFTDMHYWLSLNSLSLNCHKTENIHVITSSNSFTLPSPSFNNISIPYSHNKEYLHLEKS